jgi:hypothetical protein
LSRTAYARDLALPLRQPYCGGTSRELLYAFMAKSYAIERRVRRRSPGLRPLVSASSKSILAALCSLSKTDDLPGPASAWWPQRPCAGRQDTSGHGERTRVPPSVCDRRTSHPPRPTGHSADKTKPARRAAEAGKRIASRTRAGAVRSEVRTPQWFGSHAILFQEAL